MNRLDRNWGSRIDRDRTFWFTFEGRRIQACAGDTIASALAASGEWVLSRSFKYHRPRGVLTMSGEDANTLVQIGPEPNVRADLRPAAPDLVVTPQNVTGSLRRDRGRIIEAFSRFLPVGFYYRTFFGPFRSSWQKIWEPMIRASAGLGTVTPGLPDARYHKETRHCDVLVVGAGPAGLAAALAAAEAGAQVIVVDKEPEPGGALTYARFDLDAGAAARHLSDLRGRAQANPRIILLTGATCNGRFADNWLPVIMNDRMIRVRAAELVLATGTHEQPLIFRNNDLPGIMLSSAALRLMRHYGVRPGQRAVIYAADRDGYLAALELFDAGIAVAAVVDPETQDRDNFSSEMARRGISVRHGSTITAARAGRRGLHLHGVETLDHTGSRALIDCDLLVMAGGYTPGYQLALQSGARLASDDTGRRFSITDIPAHLHLAGAVTGLCDLDAVIASGTAAGARAAKALGLSGADAPEPAPAERHWRQPAPIASHPKGRDFVDFDEDLQVKDIENAVADGYRELELVKRYSTVGMGPSQGRHAALATARLVAGMTDRSLAQVGITTSRPPFGPEKLGLLADTTPERTRHTALHQCHLQAGARMMPVGAWWRPFLYPDSGTAGDTICREIRAVREAAGMLDVSTLGKIELRGPDAGAFLDRFYTMAHAGQPVGRVRYCLALSEMGSILDDGVAFRIAEDHFYVTATTGAVDRVFAEMTLQKTIWGLRVDIQNVTAAFAAINLTGPHARHILQSLLGDIDFSRDTFAFLEGREGILADYPVRVMRIGFTGELSFEVHLPQSCAAGMWHALTNAGARFGLRPYGLEASRILRLEKGHIIIGQDTDALSTPDQLGMGWALSRKKPFYIGKVAVEARRALRPTRQLCGFALEGENTAEIGESALVMHAGRPVGHVTSFGHSPSLGKWIGLAYTTPDQAKPGCRMQIKGFDGTTAEVDVVALPFYDPDNLRQEI